MVPPSTTPHVVANMASDVTIARTALLCVFPNSDGKAVCVFLTVTKEKTEVVTTEVAVTTLPAASVVVKTWVAVTMLGLLVGIVR